MEVRIYEIETVAIVHRMKIRKRGGHFLFPGSRKYMTKYMAI